MQGCWVAASCRLQGAKCGCAQHTARILCTVVSVLAQVRHQSQHTYGVLCCTCCTDLGLQGPTTQQGPPTPWGRVAFGRGESYFLSPSPDPWSQIHLKLRNLTHVPARRRRILILRMAPGALEVLLRRTSPQVHKIWMTVPGPGRPGVTRTLKTTGRGEAEGKSRAGS